MRAELLLGSRTMWRPFATPQVEVIQVRDSELRCSMSQERYMVALSSRGSRVIRYRHRVVEQEEGSLLLIEPGDVHVSRPASEPISMDVLFIDPSIVRCIGIDLGIDDVHWRALTVRDADLAHAFKATVSSLHAGAHQTARATFDTFIASTIRHYGTGPFHGDRIGRDSPLVRNARRLLHQQMADRVSVKEVAKQLGVTPSHLVRSFTAELGAPPHRYLVHVRVEHARSLIANGLSAVETAHAVGFSDQSHLHRHFTRIIGLTPGVYSRFARDRHTSFTRLL